MKIVKIANNLVELCIKQDNCLHCLLNCCCGSNICDWNLLAFDVKDD